MAALLKTHINSKALNRLSNVNEESAQAIAWMKEALLDHYFSEEGGKGLVFQMVKA